MKSALESFLTHLIDYAGMFPPARLSFKDAFNNYLKYCDPSSGLAHFMMARAIFSVSEIENLEKALNQLDRDPLPSSKKGFAILFRKAQTPEECLSLFKEDLLKVKDFNLKRVRAGKRSIVDCVECFLPQPLHKKSSGETVDSFLDLIQQQNVLIQDLCIEAKMECFPEFLSKVLQEKFRPGNDMPRLVAKIRTGGLTPEEIAPVDTVAKTLQSFLHYNIPFKATAGLHHPFRHLSKDPACKMHGFFNVFLGSMIASEHPDSLNAVLNMECSPGKRPEFLKILSDSIQLDDLKVSASKIVEMRAKTALSFGSCSLDEPVEDLSAF